MGLMSSDHQFVLCEAFLIFAVTKFILSYVMNLLTSLTSYLSSSCCSSSSSPSSPTTLLSSAINLRAITKSLSLTTAGNIQGRRQQPENQLEVTSSSCAVCMNSLRKKSQVWELRNCSHVFHKHCLEKWISFDESTCPLCRASLLAAESSFLPPAPPPQQHSSWAVEQMMYLFGDDLLP